MANDEELLIRVNSMPAYLDMSATTPVSKRVAEVVMRHMTEEFGNAGSRTHERGNLAKRAVRQARDSLARAVGVGPDEVIFTSGATESNNLALLGLAAHGIETGRKHIVSSVTEHKAVLEPLEHLSSLGFEVELLRPGTSGRFDPEAVVDATREDTLVVSLMQVNNETGVVQPVKEIAEELSRSNTLLHVDAAQSFGRVSVDDLRSPIDLISISGHKIGAPMGVGALITRRRGWTKVPLKPLLFGGGQERGLRPGTLPVPLIAGLGAAVSERMCEVVEWNRTTSLFRSKLIEMVNRLGGHISGDPERLAPHILNVSFPGVDSEALIVALKHLMQISSGSACTSSSYTRSHVLEGMDLDRDLVKGAVRLSWWGCPDLALKSVEQEIRRLMPI